MGRRHIRIIKLREWFPPEDDFAALIARLCILREDLLLEFMGIVEGEITRLDEGSPAWRRTYFLRNAVRTLSEIESTINALWLRSDFRRLLNAGSPAVRSQFAELKRRMEEAHGLVKDIRNSLGGHVQLKAVRRALDEMDYGRWALIEAGEILGHTHYRFAGEIVAEMLVPNAEEGPRVQRLQEDLSTIAGLTSVIALIDNVVLIYLQSRGLP